MHALGHEVETPIVGDSLLQCPACGGIFIYWYFGASHSALFRYVQHYQETHV